jgi:hypothetical protein
VIKMSNIREWGVWGTNFFTSDPSFSAVMSLMVGGFASAVGAMGLLTFGFAAILVIPLAILLPCLLALLLWQGHKISILDSLPTQNGYSHLGNYNFKARGGEYLSLPAADRALYPAHIIDVMKNPDLSFEQRVKLDNSLRYVYQQIEARDRARAELERQARVQRVDVDDIVQRLNESRESVASETGFWTEEVAKFKELM